MSDEEQFVWMKHSHRSTSFMNKLERQLEEGKELKGEKKKKEQPKKKQVLPTLYLEQSINSH